MEKIYRAAKYIRTSCPDNETQYSDSVANQRRLIDAFIQAHPEIIAVSEKIDEGYSGLFLDRPAFKELLADVESGIANCIIVKDLSRWSRDYIETGRYLRDYFPAHDVRFISIDDNVDSTRPDGFDKSIALLKSIFSEHYSRDVSVKTRSSLDIKRRQGKYVGAIPIYGYQRSVGDRHQLVPDPQTADVVKSIFHMKLCGLSASAIAEVLNRLNTPSPLAYKREHGLPCPSGGYSDKGNSLWGATTVLRILRDENYTGTLVQARQRSMSYKTKTKITLDESEWTKIKKAHEAIISCVDYEAVQRIMAMDTRTAPKNGKVHIFSGMLICGCCGGSMTRKTVKHKERRYVYYYCPTTKRNGCHSPPTINEDDLVCTVTCRIKERIVDIERLNAYLSKPQMQDLMLRERNQQITTHDMRIRDLNRYKLHLSNSIAEGLLSDAECQEFHNFYDTEIANLDIEQSTLWNPHHNGSPNEDTLECVQDILQSSRINELNRFTVAKTIRSICVHATKEIIINFTYQAEYEQLLRYLELGGHADGAKES